MTQPRVVRSGVEPVYRGRFSTTRLEEHQVTSSDGSTFVAPLYHVIDADRDPELLMRLSDGTLNHTVCPNTGEVIDLDRPVLVHSEECTLFLLVIPKSQRQQQIGHRIDLMRLLDEEQQPVPAYVLDYKIIFSPFTMADFRQICERKRLVKRIESERQRLVRVAENQEVERVRLEQWAHKLADDERRLHRLEQTPSAIADAEQPTIVTGGAGMGAPILDDLPNFEPDEDDEQTAVQYASPYPDLLDAIETLSSADIEIIDGLEGQPLVDSDAEHVDLFGLNGDERHRVGSSADDEPTGTFGIEIDLEGTSPASESLDPVQLPPDLSELPIGSGRAVRVGDRVALYFIAEQKRMKPFLTREPSALLQLHRLNTYPIIDILLVAQDQSGVPVDELFCAFDIDDEANRSILDDLTRNYVIEVHLFDEHHRRVQYTEYRDPLEHNLEHAIAAATAWLEQIPSVNRNFDTAYALFSSDGYERIGPRKHNLHKNSFAHIGTVGTARLAVSIVGYWSERHNFEYLIENRSFSIDHFRDIQRRVIEAATRFGISLRKELRERAVANHQAESEVDLVELLIENFAEASEGGGVSEIDSMAQSENWDQLLAASVDVGITIDDRVREMAETIRRKARRLASSPRIDPTELERTHEYERISSLESVSNEDLRELLQKGGVAPAVSRELVGRGGETNIFYVIESARVLDDDSVMATARFLAAGADVFEPALLMGLGRVHPRTIHLCAMALAMSKRVEALPTLIELLLDSKRGAGLPIKDILAEYGADAIPAVFDAIERHGAADDLIEVLALISIDAGGEIISALREQPTAILLEAAQKMAEVRRRLAGRRTGTLDEDDSESQNRHEAIEKQREVSDDDADSDKSDGGR